MTYGIATRTSVYCLGKESNIHAGCFDRRQQDKAFLPSDLAVYVFIIVFVKRRDTLAVSYPDVDGVWYCTKAFCRPRHIVWDVGVELEVFTV